MATSGDPLHDAFLAHLSAVTATIGVEAPWRVVDTRNTGINPDAGAPYIDFEILPGREDQVTFGAPGENFHLETGQITIGFNMPLGEHQRAAGRYAARLVGAFRTSGRTFEADGCAVTLYQPLRMGGGDIVGGLWRESMAVAYDIYHIG